MPAGHAATVDRLVEITTEGMSMRRGLVPVLVLVALALVGARFVASPVTAQEATPAGDCPATTAEENTALVTRFYELIGGGEGEFSELVADDHVYNHPSGEEISEPDGAHVEGWSDDRLEDFPDLTLTVDRMVAEGDLVAAYVTWTGTHQDDDEEEGIAATGQEAEWVGAAFFRVECGKIAEVWAVADHLGRLQDLGVITAEELQGPAATPTP
jgi:steroid delta-isomerase-like uncharacterized protein